MDCNVIVVILCWNFRNMCPLLNIQKLPFAQNLISIFGTKYSCEFLYSTMRMIKFLAYRSTLTNDHLTELLKTTLTTYNPDFKYLQKKKKRTEHAKNKKIINN